MEPLALTKEMIVVFSVLGFVIILLVFNLLRVDVVGFPQGLATDPSFICAGLFFTKRKSTNSIVFHICYAYLNEIRDS